MSGRRVYRRFSHQAPAGQRRIARYAEAPLDWTGSEISVLSDAAAVVGELLTLVLVSSTGEFEVQVRVMDSQPHFSDGAMRHRVRLEVVSPQSPTLSAVLEHQG